MQQVWREGAFAYDVVGISGAIANLTTGRLPASFLIPADDPQYNKDGSNALGVYGYMLNSRTWVYDVGLALLVFTTSGDWMISKQVTDTKDPRHGLITGGYGTYNMEDYSYSPDEIE